MNVLEAIEEHEINCITKLSRVFVSWFWMVGIFVSIALGAGTASWVISERIAKVERTMDRYELMINKVNYIADKIEQAIEGKIK
jgi:hypothetical protein